MCAQIFLLIFLNIIACYDLQYLPLKDSQPSRSETSESIHTVLNDHPFCSANQSFVPCLAAADKRQARRNYRVNASRILDGAVSFKKKEITFGPAPRNWTLEFCQCICRLHRAGSERRAGGREGRCWPHWHLRRMKGPRRLHQDREKSEPGCAWDCVRVREHPIRPLVLCKREPTQRDERICPMLQSSVEAGLSRESRSTDIQNKDAFYSLQNVTSTNQVLVLGPEATRFFCKGLDTMYFRPCGHPVLVTASRLCCWGRRVATMSQRAWLCSSKILRTRTGMGQIWLIEGCSLTF